MRLEIKEPGFENYTGFVGPVEFVDGVSVGAIEHSERVRLGSIFKLVCVDTGRELGAAADIVLGNEITADAYQATAPISVMRRELMDVGVDPSTIDQGSLIGGSVQTPAQLLPETAQALPANGTKFTEDELSAIADKSGINGLREIADAMGVKSHSIKGLIKAIIDKQNALA